MKRFVIYSVIVAAYDNVLQPLVVDDRFDYVLFTDNSNINKLGVWQIHKIEYNNNDNTRIARYIKTHPEVLLPEYEASLWLDANLQIISCYIYNRFIELYENGIQLASVCHPYRDCIFDEAYNVYGLDKEETIFEWCHYLRNVNYPQNNGLYETGVLYRRNDSQTKVIDDLWWKAICKYSRRDQLSLNFILWENPLKQDYILPVGECVTNSNNVIKFGHTLKADQKGNRGINESFWEHARNRCRHGIKEKEKKFREFHYWLYGLNPILGKTLLYIWGFYATVVYGLTIKRRTKFQHI